MEKKVINEEQFKRLVIEEAKKYMSEDTEKSINSKKRITIENVESLINKIESKNKSISSIKLDNVFSESKGLELDKKISRDIDMDNYNSKKNIIHINEEEKGKWQRMLNYEIPSDEKR